MSSLNVTPFSLYSASEKQRHFEGWILISTPGFSDMICAHCPGVKGTLLSCGIFSSLIIPIVKAIIQIQAAKLSGLNG